MAQATADRATETRAGLDERLQRRLATYVIPLMGEPLPAVVHWEPEPARRPGRRVALAASLVVVAMLVAVVLLVQLLP